MATNSFEGFANSQPAMRGGAMFGPEGPMPFGAKEFAQQGLGYSALTSPGEAAIPFGSDVMTVVPPIEDSEFVCKISGSVPTAQTTRVLNGKRWVELSDGDDVSRDD